MCVRLGEFARISASVLLNDLHEGGFLFDGEAGRCDGQIGENGSFELFGNRDCVFEFVLSLLPNVINPRCGLDGEATLSADDVLFRADFI